MNFTVYSKQGCPFCTKVVQVLQLSKLNHVVYELDQDFDKEIQFVTGDEWKAGNLSYHLKSRPVWEGFTNDKIIKSSSQFICVDEICMGRY